MRELSLPSWAKLLGPGKVELDASKFYPELLAELEAPQTDQFWLEVAYQCAKMDVQLAVVGTEAAPPAGGALLLFIEDSKWAQKNYPKGEGPEAASAGRKWREHYARIRPGMAML